MSTALWVAVCQLVLLMAARSWNATQASLAAAQAAVLGPLMLVTTYFDLKERRIPNGAVFASVTIAIGLSGLAPHILGNRHVIVGLFACGGALIPFYSAGHLGAGDVKLAAAIGAVLGPHEGLSCLCLSCLAAGGFTAIAAIWGWRDLPRGTIDESQVPVSNTYKPVARNGLPFACFLLAGTLTHFAGLRAL